jgi:hypothetical protein
VLVHWQQHQTLASDYSSASVHESNNTQTE